MQTTLLNNQLRNFRDAYSFIYSTYSRSTREKLLEFLGATMPAAELETYKNTPQIELAEIYSFMRADHILRTSGITDESGKKALYEEIRGRSSGVIIGGQVIIGGHHRGSSLVF